MPEQRLPDGRTLWYPAGMDPSTALRNAVDLSTPKAKPLIKPKPAAPVRSVASAAISSALAPRSLAVERWSAKAAASSAPPAPQTLDQALRSAAKRGVVEGSRTQADWRRTFEEQNRDANTQLERAAQTDPGLFISDIISKGVRHAKAATGVIEDLLRPGPDRGYWNIYETSSPGLGLDRTSYTPTGSDTRAEYLRKKLAGGVENAPMLLGQAVAMARMGRIAPNSGLEDMINTSQMAPQASEVMRKSRMAFDPTAPAAERAQAGVEAPVDWLEMIAPIALGGAAHLPEALRLRSARPLSAVEATAARASETSRVYPDAATHTVGGEPVAMLPGRAGGRERWHYVGEDGSTGGRVRLRGGQTPEPIARAFDPPALPPHPNGLLAHSDTQLAALKSTAEQAMPGAEVSPRSDGYGVDITLPNGKTYVMGYTDQVPMDVEALRKQDPTYSPETHDVPALFDPDSGHSVGADGLIWLARPKGGAGQSKLSTVMHEAFHMALHAVSTADEASAVLRPYAKRMTPEQRAQVEANPGDLMRVLEEYGADDFDARGYRADSGSVFGRMRNWAQGLLDRTVMRGTDAATSRQFMRDLEGGQALRREAPGAVADTGANTGADAAGAPARASIVRVETRDGSKPLEPHEMTRDEFRRVRPAVPGYLYHGSPTGDLSGPVDTYGGNTNREGIGFFTTDSREAAQMYADGRTAKGDVKANAPFRGRVNYVRGEVKRPLQMDAPADPELWHSVAAEMGYDGWQMETERKGRPATNGDAYRQLIVDYGTDMGGVSEAQYAVDETLHYNERYGYDAIQHQEGKLGEPHNVTVYRGENRPEIVRPEVVHRQVVEQALRDGKDVPDHVAKDYPDLAAGGQRGQVVRREAPKVYMTQDDLQPNGERRGIPSFTIKGRGEVIQGAVVDKSRLPDELYHVTSNLPEVSASGMLRSMGGKDVGGLGKGSSPSHHNVSLTRSSAVADALKTDMLRQGEVARQDAPLDVLLARYAAEDAAKAGDAQLIKQGASDAFEWSKMSPEYADDPQTWLNAFSQYMRHRERAGGAENPLFYGRAEQAVNLTPETVGVVRVRASDIPDGALIRIHPHGNAGLDEVAVHAEVPIAGSSGQRGQVVRKGHVDVQPALGEWGDTDPGADSEVRRIAAARGIGVTRDRDLATVARGAKGEILGGTFTAYDHQTGAYTFDVVVDKRAEGRGVGGALLDSVIDLPYDIREMNPDATVRADVVSPTMRRMLERRGFGVTQRLHGDRVIMEPKQQGSSVGQRGQVVLRHQPLLRENLPAKRQGERHVDYALRLRSYLSEHMGVERLADDTPENTRAIGDLTAHEAAMELQNNPNNGLKWYQGFPKAIALASKTRPELRKDPVARDVYTVLTAIMSQGAEVDVNFTQMESIYDYYRAHGALPEGADAAGYGTGKAAPLMREGLATINRGAEKFGSMKAFMQFLKTPMSDAELRAMGGVDSPTGMGNQTYGSMIFGPKLGAFMQNLWGNHGPITIDRWLMKTLGRYINRMIPNSEPSFARFRAAVEADPSIIDGYKSSASKKAALSIGGIKVDPETGKLVATDEQLVDLANTVNSAHEKAFKASPKDNRKGKNELEFAAKRLHDTTSSVIEEPTVEDRRRLHAIFEHARNVLRTEYNIEVSNAELQALLWYPEQQHWLESRSSQSYLDVAEAKYGPVTPDVEAVANSLPTNPGLAGPARLQQIRRGVLGAVHGYPVHPASGGPGNEAGPTPYASKSDTGRAVGLLDGTEAPVVARFTPTKAAQNRLNPTPLPGESAVSHTLLPWVETNDPAAFHRAISHAKSVPPASAAEWANMACVDVHSDYTGTRGFLTEDGAAMFALDGDDIVSVVKTPGSSLRGVAHSALTLAVQEGGRRLNCVDTLLADMYGQAGFKAVSRVKWDDAMALDGMFGGDAAALKRWKDTMAQYNDGSPDVVLMAYDPAYQKLYEAGDGVLCETWDQAEAMQKAAVAEVAGRGGVGAPAPDPAAPSGQRASIVRRDAEPRKVPDTWQRQGDEVTVDPKGVPLQPQPAEFTASINTDKIDMTQVSNPVELLDFWTRQGQGLRGYDQGDPNVRALAGDEATRLGQSMPDIRQHATEVARKGAMGPRDRETLIRSIGGDTTQAAATLDNIVARLNKGEAAPDIANSTGVDARVVAAVYGKLGGRHNHAMTELEAVGLTPTQLRRGVTSGKIDRPMALAIKGHLLQLADTVRATTQAYQQQGTFEAQAAMATAISEHQAVYNALAGARSEFGRALESCKIISGMLKQLNGSNGSIKDKLRDQLKKLIGEDAWSPEVTQELLAIQDGDHHAMNALLRKHAGFTWMDKLSSFMVANWLSSPAGLAADFAANALWGASENLAVKPLGAVLDTMTHREINRKTSLAEAGIRAASWFGAMPAAWDDMMQVVRHGMTDAQATMMDLPGHYEFDGKMKAFNYPTRLRGAQDAFWRRMTINAEINARAWRAAQHEYLGGNILKDERAMYADKYRAVATLIEGGGDLSGLSRNELESGQAVLDAATAAGRRSVFEDEPDELLSAMYKLQRVRVGKTDAQPGRIIFPFLRVPYNVFKRGVESTPLGLAKFGLDPSMKRNAGGEATDHAARLMIASTIGAGLAAYAAGGGITGEMPKTPAGRDQWNREGKQPWSIRVGDKWVTYLRWGPLAYVPAMAAAFAAKGMGSEGTPPKYSQVYDASLMILRFLQDQGAAAGIKQILDTINDRSGTGSRLISGASNWMTSMAQGFLPGSALMRDISQSLDPVVRDPKNLYERIVGSTLPLLSKNMNPRIDTFGDQVTRAYTGPARVLPWAFQQAKGDAATKELGRLRMTIPYTPRTISIGGKSFDLSREQSVAYGKLVGPQIKAVLNDLVLDPDYRSAPDTEKITMMNRAQKRVRANMGKEFKAKIAEELGL